MDFGNVITPRAITSFSKYSGFKNVRGGTLGNETWVANLAVYIPFAIPFSYEVRRVFWANGATASGNVNLALYTFGGTLIYSTGSTAQSGTTQLQYVDNTDFILSPGKYYWGVTNSSATANLMYGLSNLAAGQLTWCGLLQEALGGTSFFSTMTPVTIANALCPVVGMTKVPSGF